MLKDFTISFIKLIEKEGPLKAFVDITFKNGWVIRDFRVFEYGAGPFCKAPQVRERDEAGHRFYRQIVIIPKPDFKIIADEILKVYDEKLKEHAVKEDKEKDV